MLSVASVCLVLLYSMLLLLPLNQATIQCLCTTRECQRNHEISCGAATMCYVQYMPVPAEGDDIRAGETAPSTPVVRGCIDDRTPLLCENKRPQAYTGLWPVLLCCQESWCNKDVLPTLPSWAEHIEDERMFLDDDDEQPDDNHDNLPNTATETVNETGEENYDRTLYDQSYLLAKNTQLTKSSSAAKSRTTSSSYYINPLYIGVPIAGACVLLAIIIFAIYILKRQNQYMEEYQCRHGLKHQYAVHPRSPPGKAILVPTACHGHNCIYAASECDRSSNGSETRLLMKV